MSNKVRQLAGSRDASEKGCQFMDQVKVVKVLHSGGKAVGALCQDTQLHLLVMSLRLKAQKSLSSVVAH